MKILKSFLISLSLLIFISFSPTLGFSQNEIIIRTYLFKGFHEGFQPGPKPGARSSDDIIKVPVRYDPDNPDIADVDSIKNVIRSAYRITYTTLLTSAYVTWDGKKENINEAVLNSIRPLSHPTVPDAYNAKYLETEN